MPDMENAATRWVSAKNGAMKLHQSAQAPLPCRNNSPGLPRSPQASVSIAAPRTSMNVRSGASRDRVVEPLRSRRLCAVERRQQMPPVVGDGFDLVHSASHEEGPHKAVPDVQWKFRVRAMRDQPSTAA